MFPRRKVATALRFPKQKPLYAVQGCLGNTRVLHSAGLCQWKDSPAGGVARGKKAWFRENWPKLHCLSRNFRIRTQLTISVSEVEHGTARKGSRRGGNCGVAVVRLVPFENSNITLTGISSCRLCC